MTYSDATRDQIKTAVVWLTFSIGKKIGGKLPMETTGRVFVCGCEWIIPAEWPILTPLSQFSCATLPSTKQKQKNIEQKNWK